MKMKLKVGTSISINDKRFGKQYYLNNSKMHACLNFLSAEVERDPRIALGCEQSWANPHQFLSHIFAIRWDMSEFLAFTKTLGYAFLQAMMTN
jgi:hypothetical protein